MFKHIIPSVLLLAFVGCVEANEPVAHRSDDRVHEVVYADPTGIYNADGEPLSGEIHVSRDVRYVQSGVTLLIEGRPAVTGASGTCDRVLAPGSADVLTCACMDSNDAQWTQDCGGGQTCDECCTASCSGGLTCWGMPDEIIIDTGTEPWQSSSGCGDIPC